MPFFPCSSLPGCLGIISLRIRADESGICPDTFGSSAAKGSRKMARRGAVTQLSGCGMVSPSLSLLLTASRGWKRGVPFPGASQHPEQPALGQGDGWERESWVLEDFQEPSRRVDAGEEKQGWDGGKVLLQSRSAPESLGSIKTCLEEKEAPGAASEHKPSSTAESPRGAQPRGMAPCEIKPRLLGLVLVPIGCSDTSLAPSEHRNC